MELSEGFRYHTRWVITRYKNTEDFKRGLPSFVPDPAGPPGSFLPPQSFVEGNVLLNEGIQAIEDLLIGAATPTKWDNGNARIGVGDNNTGAANTQGGLQAPTNKAWLTMSANYPSRATQTITWQASADANTANYGWQEFTVVNAANDTGNNINRVANNQGTKVAGQVWTVAVQLTIS